MSTNNHPTIKLLEDRILIKQDQAEQKTAGGLYIPDTAQKQPKRGTVISVGPGKKDAPVTLKKSQKVIYEEYAGTEVTLQGEKYIIMRETNIIGIL